MELEEARRTAEIEGRAVITATQQKSGGTVPIVNDRRTDFRIMKNPDDFKKINTLVVGRLADYIVANRIHNLIIGVSGGIDSALMCAIARQACDLVSPSKSKNVFTTKLVGYSLPIDTKSDEENRANAIGSSFCDIFENIDLSRWYYASLPFMNYSPYSGSFNESINKGNIKARLRMIFLYDAARQGHGMVLSTDNLTEYLLGFWTLHGDVGDFGCIQHLWKTEVYGLSDWIMENIFTSNGSPAKNMSLKSCAQAVPTDGLGITDSDFEQLGLHNYYEIDEDLYDLISGNVNGRVLSKKIESKFWESEFKRLNPIAIQRMDFINTIRS